MLQITTCIVKEGAICIIQKYINIKQLKKSTLAICLLLGLFFLNGFSKISNIDLTQVEKIEEFANVFKSGDLFFARQPSFELLKKLKEDGATTIINLRSEEEMAQFKQTGFDEEQLSTKMGLNYHNLPLRNKEYYNPNF